MIKLFRAIFRWIKKLFKKPVKPPLVDVPQTRYERSRIKKTHTPSTRFAKTYSRAYARFQAHKKRTERQAWLRSQGLKDVINDDGSISTIAIQPPYRKTLYKSLDKYNAMVKGFNYKNKDR